MAVAAVLAIVYLILEPPSADLAAQTFRSDLFGAHGFLLWSNDWYGGHYLPGYSVLFPALGAAVGPRLVGALAAVAAAGLFGALARHAHGDRARLATLWFGAGTATMLFSGRLTFALGIAVGLGALLALQRRRPLLAAVLAVLTACASPIAGLFAGLAGVAVMLAGDRRGGALVALGALGALYAVTLRTVPAYTIHRLDRPRPLDEVYERFDELAELTDHFEFYVFPHTTTALCRESTRTSQPPRPRAAAAA
jgi:hypothetical protein